MITNIVNAFLNVRNKVKNNKGEWVDKTSYPGKQVLRSAYRSSIPLIAENPNGFQVFETDKAIIIDSFEFGTIDREIGVKLHPFGVDYSNTYDTNLFYNIHASGRGWASAGGIGSRGNDYFDIKEYDEISSRYSFVLRKPIVMPQGARLQFFGSSSYTGDGHVTWRVVYRELE